MSHKQGMRNKNSFHWRKSMEEEQREEVCEEEIRFVES